MVALLALVLILAIFGGLGFAAHVLWYILIFAVLLWLIGFFVGGVEGGGRGAGTAADSTAGRWDGTTLARPRASRRRARPDVRDKR